MHAATVRISAVTHRCAHGFRSPTRILSCSFTEHRCQGRLRAAVSSRRNTEPDLQKAAVHTQSRWNTASAVRLRHSAPLMHRAALRCTYTALTLGPATDQKRFRSYKNRPREVFDVESTRAIYRSAGDSTINLQSTGVVNLHRTNHVRCPVLPQVSSESLPRRSNSLL